MLSKNVRRASLRRVLNGLEAELERVHGMTLSGEVPSPVAEKVVEELTKQRYEILAELSEVKNSDD